MRNLYNQEDWMDLPDARLGEIFIEAGLINMYHLSMVLDIQRFQNLSIGTILLEMKVISDSDLQQALHIQELIRNKKNV